MALNTDSYWASDVRVSIPVAPTNDAQVDLGGGFVFTVGGIAHDITEATAKQISTPTFAPANANETIYEDTDLAQSDTTTEWMVF